MSLLKDGIQTKYPEGVILFELRTPTTEVFVVSTFPDAEWNEFVLVWSDYVANVWEEKYEFLSQATARMAQLIHLSEQDETGETIMFDAHGDEFTSAWENFLKETTVTIGAK